MNDRMILQLLDSERQTIADSEVMLEKTPYVVRAIGTETEGSWNGIVYSHFSITEAKEVINDEISYFVKIGRGFEWKVYSHDQPSDLLTRLRCRGFKIGEEEALMVLDLRELPARLLASAPEGITVRAVTDDLEISHFLVLEAAIWGRSTTTREFLLSSLSDQLQRNLAFVAYADHKPDRIRARLRLPAKLFRRPLEWKRSLGLSRARRLPCTLVSSDSTCEKAPFGSFSVG